MTDTLQTPSQLAPNANTLTDLYTVPALTKALVSAIKVCNRSSEQGTFRIAIAIAGAALEDKQYAYFDEPIGGNRTWSVVEGWTLGAGDVVRVLSSNGQMSFLLFKVERS